MTFQQFEIAAEIWYQRAKNLARYSQDESNTSMNRDKAFLLHLIMAARVSRCMQIYIKRSVVKPGNFKEGGIIG